VQVIEDEDDLPEVREAPPNQLAAELTEYLAGAQREVVLSTAYLIPSDDLLAVLGDIAGRGARVVLLTNSLASNNHMVAQMAFKPWRRKLLDIGVDLYESRADSVYISEYSTPPVEPTFLGLHVKAIVVDDHLSAEAWCRMHLDVLSGDDAIGFDEGLHEISATRQALPSSAHAGPFRPRDVDASR